MKARMASLAAPLGLLLAWGGLFLPWRHWSAEAGDGSSSGFHEAKAFWIVLAVVTVLVLVAQFARYSVRERERRWVQVVVAVGALALVGIAVRAIALYLAEASTFVSVGPGIGVLISLIGAMLVLGAALAPQRHLQRWALAAIVLIVGVAALWPAPDGRPSAGTIAEISEAGVRSLAFHDGALYGTDPTYLHAVPRAGRTYDAYRISSTRWFGGLADGFADDIAFAGDNLYAILGNLDRVGTLTPDGKADTTAQGAHALALAPGPDDGVYLLTPDGVSLLRGGRVTEVAAIDLDDPRDIAADGKGGAYVADTGNGRVLHVDAKGEVTTIVGTDAAPGCASDGEDDPLTLETGRCTAVSALAADDDGNVYLALRSVAMIVGVRPKGRMAVVAGTGPLGWGDGGQAVQARIGRVNALAVGPDGDLYVDEDSPIGRLRRIADPAGLLDQPRPKPAAPSNTAACSAIAQVRDTALSSSGPTELDAALAALDRAAPDEIRERVDELINDYRRHQDDDKRLTEVIWYHDGYRTTVADYAEEECGLIAGYDLSAADANRFCLAYQRYLDTHENVPRTGTEPPPEWETVKDAAPPMLEFANTAVVGDFARSICVVD